MSKDHNEDNTEAGKPAGGRQALLSLQRVSKFFGATTALEQVSIDFFPGEVHCVLGENGAGKSTIAKIMGGIHQPDEGRMLWRGRPVSFHDVGESRDCGVALVFQELSLAPDLSVRANLHLGVKQAGGFGVLRHEREARRVAGLLERLACDVDPEEPVGSLPGALQQLVEIAKALMQEPELIVLDEPTAMLGAVEKRKLFEVVRGLRDQGKALVLITHHIDDVLSLADRVSIMRNGQLVDSFDMSAGMGADDLLERVTGGKVARAASGDERRHDGELALAIENYPGRQGGSLPVLVPRGAIVGLYGVVGCGALDIIHALAGLRVSSFMRFTLCGRPFLPHSPAQAAARGVSYLPTGRASNGIFASLSIRENLSLTMLTQLGRCGLIPQHLERDRSGQMLARFGVKFHDMDDPIGSLSGGNQQKVLMARAMVKARHVLLLEDPTAGIDVGAKAQLHEHIRALAQSGAAVILLSSDLVETIQLCDTVYTFYDDHIMSRYDAPSLDDQAAIVADVLGQPSQDCMPPVGLWRPGAQAGTPHAAMAGPGH